MSDTAARGYLLPLCLFYHVSIFSLQVNSNKNYSSIRRLTTDDIVCDSAISFFVVDVFYNVFLFNARGVWHHKNRLYNYVEKIVYH